MVLKDHLSRSNDKYGNLPMTNVIKENCQVIYDPVGSNKLVVFLMNCHEVPLNLPHNLFPCKLVSKGECGPRSGKG